MKKFIRNILAWFFDFVPLYGCRLQPKAEAELDWLVKDGRIFLSWSKRKVRAQFYDFFALHAHGWKVWVERYR